MRPFVLILLVELFALLLVVVAPLGQVLASAGWGLAGPKLLNVGFWAVARARDAACEHPCEPYAPTFVPFVSLVLTVEAIAPGEANVAVSPCNGGPLVSLRMTYRASGQGMLESARRRD